MSRLYQVRPKFSSELEDLFLTCAHAHADTHTHKPIFQTSPRGERPGCHGNRGWSAPDSEGLGEVGWRDVSYDHQALRTHHKEMPSSMIWLCSSYVYSLHEFQLIMLKTWSSLIILYWSLVQKFSSHSCFHHILNSNTQIKKWNVLHCCIRYWEGHDASASSSVSPTPTYTQWGLLGSSGHWPHAGWHSRQGIPLPCGTQGGEYKELIVHVCVALKALLQCLQHCLAAYRLPACLRAHSFASQTLCCLRYLADALIHDS